MFLKSAPAAFAIAVVLAAISNTARAQENAAEPAWETAPATRRTGFALGLELGFGVGSIVGYPNDVKKMNLARYYTATGVRPASTGILWLGGAITDWFDFGVGFGGGPLFATGDNKASAGGFLFHVEAFPLFWKGGAWRDVGAMFDAGTGQATVAPSDNADMKLVDSSAASMIGGGFFYDGFRFSRFGSGPFIMGNYFWSQTALRPAIFIGWRTALYAGKIIKP